MRERTRESRRRGEEEEKEGERAPASGSGRWLSFLQWSLAWTVLFYATGRDKDREQHKEENDCVSSSRGKERERGQSRRKTA